MEEDSIVLIRLKLFLKYSMVCCFAYRIDRFYIFMYVHSIVYLLLCHFFLSFVYCIIRGWHAHGACRTVRNKTNGREEEDNRTNKEERRKEKKEKRKEEGRKNLLVLLIIIDEWYVYVIIDGWYVYVS